MQRVATAAWSSVRHFHRIALRGLLGPFFGWLGLLLFLILLQFLIKYLPDLAGRDLPPLLICELVAYNLAYMVVLAVPMSAMLASLMAFGTLAESRAYVVIKTSGVSAFSVIWPALVAGGILALGMSYFNNVLLPEANFRAHSIWQDVHAKRPGFDLQPGVFYDGLDEYAILVRHRTGNRLEDILIYDQTNGRGRGATIRATSGRLASRGAAAVLDLEKGEIHRFLPNTTADMRERYERSTFNRLRLTLDLSEFNFARASLSGRPRSDRSTRTSVMVRVVDSLRTLVKASRASLRSTVPVVAPSGTSTASRPEDLRRVHAMAGNAARMASDEVARTHRGIERQMRYINRYSVEIHKKYSIAAACLIFILLGAPLGLSIRRGGLGVSALIPIGVFLLYWTTLVQGEKLADRGLMSPWISMWTANILVGLVALGMFLYVSLELRAVPPLLMRHKRKAGHIKQP